MIDSIMQNKVHEGRNLKRIREILGKKQDAIAIELGDDWTQKKISLLESKEVIEPEILEQVSKVLGVTPEAIKNFNEEAAINIIGNTVNNHDNAAVVNYYPSFNPVDKVMELYERMLNSEKEKNELLEKLLNEKQGKHK
jgi:transcriptional regulator with XRE-family HTH domain